LTSRILFTTSNGTGLGHLTRSMAIARRLGPGAEPLFLTLSGAAPVVSQMGFPVEYVASYATPGSGNDYRWSRRLRSRLRVAIAEAAPDVVVFDGTHPYEALLGALPPQTTAVWCRRPLWKHGSSRAPLGRAGAFDAVLEPGELAESEDRGPTVALRDRAHRVDPIVLLDPDELVPRAQAEAELGLEPGMVNVLVALGQGEEVREATARCLRHLAGRTGIQVVAISSALGALGDTSVPEGIVELRATYPMSRYFAAFDAAVAAGGYNAFHELIHLGVPSLFVPMARQTDDQAARARWAEKAGVGLAVEASASPLLEAQLERLLDSERRELMNGGIRELGERNGAGEAAAWLEALVGGEAAASTGAADAGAGKRGSFRAWRRRWGTFAASVPRTAVRLTRQQLTEPRPRTLILAFGLGEGAPAAVREALARTPDDPRRVLVLTDSFEFAALRELGVGFEHVPPPGSRQAELAGVPYEEFRRGRAELILAERPQPRRTLVAPGSEPLP
jgi:UDP:flavonoid glycosyltransferase YjiC (YdhE family)